MYYFLLNQFLQCNTVSLATLLLWDYELKKFCDTKTCSTRPLNSHYSRPFQLIWAKIKPWRWSNQGGKHLTLIIFWLSFIMNNNLFIRNDPILRNESSFALFYLFVSSKKGYHQEPNYDWLKTRPEKKILFVNILIDKWAGHGYILDLVSGYLIKMSEFCFENMLMDL